MTEEKRFHDFRITAPGPTSNHRGTETEMDGIKLKGVRSVRLSLVVGEVNAITIEMIAGSVNADVVAEVAEDPEQ